MKIGKLICNKFGHPLKPGDDEYTYTHLILETIDDALRYYQYFADISSDKNIQALFGFKSQDFRKSFADYLTHEGPNTPSVTKALAMKLNFKETDTSITEFCEMTDNLINNKIKHILNFINNDYLVRINHVGGYCTIDNIDNYIDIIEPTDKQLATYINLGTIEDDKININTKSVIIENDFVPSDDFKNKLFQKIDRNNLQIINNFKTRTSGFTDKDFLKIFQSGIDNGLRNICFETTGQDYHNILKLHNLYKILVDNNPSITLKIYFSTVDKKITQLFSNENCELIK